MKTDSFCKIFLKNSADFYPYFCSLLFKPYFKKKQVYRPSKFMLIQGSDKDSFFGPNFNCSVTLWLFDFSEINI